MEPIPTNINGLLDLIEAANYLRISNRALRDLCKRRAVSYVRMDRLNWRFRRSALDAYLDRLTVRAKEVYA